MFLHGRGRRHAVEQLELLAVALDDFAPGLVVAGQHAAQHDEIGAGSERLGHVSGASAAAVLRAGRGGGPRHRGRCSRRPESGDRGRATSPGQVQPPS